MNTPGPNRSAQLKTLDDTIRGVAPTRTVGETYAPPAVSKTADVITLFKMRVTSMIILTAWAGYYMAARKHGLAPLTLQLLFTLVGVAMVASAAAALNQVIERDADGRMLRTKDRPLPTKRMTVRLGYTIAVVTGIVGLFLLAYFANILTAGLALL